MSNIDWSRPLEAYHEDGRVLSVTIDFSDDRSCIFTKEELGGGQRWFRPNGDAINEACGWRIRNKYGPKADIPEWAIKRAREIIGEDRQAHEGIAFDAFARYIAKHEEPPVDPAEAIVDELLRLDASTRTIIRRAIQRGRELERGEVK